MEKKIASYKSYDLFLADKDSLCELAQFIVRENYTHHSNIITESKISEDIKNVHAEEEYLYGNQTRIYIARDVHGNMVGCIRTFHWDRRKILPIEKIYGINPLYAIHEEPK